MKPQFTVIFDLPCLGKFMYLLIVTRFTAPPERKIAGKWGKLRRLQENQRGSGREGMWIMEETRRYLREGEVTKIEVYWWRGQGNREREGRPAWLIKMSECESL